MQLTLNGRNAIVFGGGQTPGATLGNGRAVALLLAEQGCRVLVVDRDLESAKETTHLITQAGGESKFALADVTSEEDVASAIQLCKREWGGVDILHNNVGVGVLGGDAPTTEITSEAYTRIMDINLKGMVLAAKHALPIMREQGSGVIINIGSIAAKMAYPTVAYKTSKAAVIALTEHLAIENAKFGIRVNAILPGLIETPMAVEHKITKDQSRAEVLSDRAARIPLKNRVGTAHDVANAVAFLASEEGSFITGAALTVDGGQTLQVG
jgi:NAD(P)-dependent dehydrogenase (short-subunit alcohol dehydrogenase family)